MSWCKHPAIVGVLECLGQPRSPPRDRLGERPHPQRLSPFRPRPGRAGVPSSSRAASNSAPVFAERVRGDGKTSASVSSAEIGHAEQMKARDDVDMIRVNRDDVRVLQASASVCGSREPARDTLRATGRSAR